MLVGNLNRLYEMTKTEYMRELDRFLSMNKSNLLNVISLDDRGGTLGHAAARHVRLTDEDMVKRNVLECHPCSTFDEPERMNAYVYTALMGMKDKIADWFLSADEDSKGWNGKFKKPIGHGVDLKFKGKITPTIHLELQRSRDPNSSLGFVIKTAYPYIQSKHATENGLDYRELAERLNGKEFTYAEDILRWIKNDTDLNVSLNARGDIAKINFYLSHTNNDRIILYASKDGEDFALKSNGILDRNFGYDDIFFTYPQLEDKIHEALNIIDDVAQMRRDLECEHSEHSVSQEIPIYDSER